MRPLMKTLMVFSFVLYSLPALAAQGGDSSAGGGGGALHLLNWNGKMHLEANSAEGGLASDALRVLLLAGAKMEESKNFISYEVPGTTLSVTKNKLESPDSAGHLRFSVILEPSEIVELRYGNDLASLSFSGPAAHALFQALAKSGREPSWLRPDPQHPGEYIPGAFEEGNLICSLATALPENCTLRAGD